MTDEETYQLLKEDYRISVDLQLLAMGGLLLKDYLDVGKYAQMGSLRVACIQSSMDLSDFIYQSVHKHTDLKL